MTLQSTTLAIGIASTLIPVVSVYLRDRSRELTLAAFLTALAFAFHMASLLQLHAAGPASTAGFWVFTMVASTVPMVLSVFLFSLMLGRERPLESLKRSRRTFLLLIVAGIAVMAGLRSGSFITGYDWNDGRGTIHLGWLGKAYVSYLLIGIVLIGYNLESTYRLASSNVRHRLKLPFLGFFGLLGYMTFVLTTGILYSSLGLGKLTAIGLPIALCNALIGYGFVRGALSDVAAPVSRNVVYSSFTALAAGLYVLAVGVVAQVASFTKWSPDEVVILSFGFLVVLTATLLLFSNRFQRRVRRFIDRNFYVNRFDYRTQWSNVTTTLENAMDRDDVVARATTLLREVFLADEVTISLKEEATQKIRPFEGKGSDKGGLTLESSTPLFARLLNNRTAMLLDRMPHDFEYIPIYAENHDWLDFTASQVLTPIFDGQELVGTIGLERNHKDDPFSFEDVSLLESISTHVGASLRAVTLVREVAETRELELMSQWSNMLLHDLKNYLTPLRMVAENLITYSNKPNITEIASRDIQAVSDRMETLVRTLSELRENPDLGRESIDPNQIVKATLSEMQVSRRRSVDVELDLKSKTNIHGDRTMLQRVFENLVSNAMEAMPDGGVLKIRTSEMAPTKPDVKQILIQVIDSGQGISETFVREQLFRPFATTKKKGLGLGLYQSRSIIRAHGGELTVQSTPGSGSTFSVSLASTSREPEPQVDVRAEPAPTGVLS